MNLDDIISLFVIVVAIIYTLISVFKTITGLKKEEKDYLDEDEDEDEEYEVKKPKAKAKSLPPEAPKQQPSSPKSAVFRSKLDDYTTRTSIDDQHLDIHLRSPNDLVSDAFRVAESEGAVVKRAKKASIHDLIKALPSKKLIFLSYEVFSQPVSRRKTPFPWNG